MLSIRAAVSSLVVAFVAAACSAGVVSPGLSDGGGDPPGDGGCIEPTEGAACTSNKEACPSNGNICCIGYAWGCVGGVWKKQFVGCACMQTVDSGTDAARRDAGPVVCGGKTCAANEYCTTGSGGPELPDGGSNVSYSCDKIPAACSANATCACLQTNGGGGGCSCADVNGWPQVTCNYP